MLSSDLTKDDILSILDRAQYFSQNSPDYLLNNTLIANLFFENSTRTRFSFEVAEKRMGARIINFEAGSSSLSKGESLEDTLKTLQALGVQMAVIRHSDDHFFAELKDKLKINLINAGAGKREHPTQGLLDLLTIQQEFGTLDGLKIAIAGDIKYSRVAGSLIGYMKNFNSEVHLCGPEMLLPTEDELDSHCRISKLDDILPELDVLVLLRIQTERHSEMIIKKEEYLPLHGLTVEREKKMKKNSIIMHPAPVNRGVEIDAELVECERSRIFKQMSNGVFARMAVLEWLTR